MVASALSNRQAVHVHAKHYKHNGDGRTAPGVCGNGSVPLNVPLGGTSLRELEYTHTYPNHKAELSVVCHLNIDNSEIFDTQTEV